MPNQKIRVEYIDALAGAGKTRTAARWAVNQARTHDAKIIITQPSIYLLTQTLNDIEEYCRKENLFVKVTAVHGEDSKHGIAASSSHVVGDITTHLKKTAQNIGEILLITHAAFQIIPHFHMNKNWTVLWDEVLDPIRDITLNINESFNKMLPFDKWFDVYNSEFADCYLVMAKDAAKAELADSLSWSNTLSSCSLAVTAVSFGLPLIAAVVASICGLSKFVCRLAE